MFGRLRQGGLADLAWRGLRRLGVYRRFVLIGGPDVARSQTSAIPVVCARLERPEIGEYLAFRPDQTRAAIGRRLDAGDWCFVGRSGGRLVAAVWAARESVWLEFLSCRLELAERTFFIYDLYVRPELRGKRVADPVNELRMVTLRAAGYDRKVALYEPENRPALRRGERRGNTRIATLSCLRLGPWRRLRLRPDDDEAEPLVWIAGAAPGTTPRGRFPGVPLRPDIPEGGTE